MDLFPSLAHNQRLLLGSGGLSTPARRERWCAAFDAFLPSVERFVFLPYAIADHEFYVRRMIELGLTVGREIVGLHTQADPVAAIEAADAIYVGGGNSFRLLRTVQAQGLLEPIRRRVAAGTPYIGISAGTNLACPTIMTTNDMPIVAPVGFEALRLIPFQINAHYFSGKTWIRQADETFVAYGGETRDDRIREYHEQSPLPVLGMWEGGWLRIEAGAARLEGAPARLFLPGEPAQDLAADTSLAYVRG